MGFPATESGPFGPARFLAGFGENERNVAPLPAVEVSNTSVAAHSVRSRVTGAKP